MRILSLLILFFTMGWLAGCSKNEEAGITFEYPLSDSALAGSYKITASLYYPGAQESPVDDYALWDFCRKATLYHFDAGLDYLEENPADCPDNVLGTWYTDGTNLVVEIEGTGGTTAKVYALQSFNLAAFRVRENLAQGDYYVKTYTRQ